MRKRALIPDPCSLLLGSPRLDPIDLLANQALGCARNNFAGEIAHGPIAQLLDHATHDPIDQRIIIAIGSGRLQSGWR